MTLPEPVDIGQKPGLRERNKQDKAARIRAAALELFETKGFEATTTREIAERAEVGIGTLFIYAQDKRDIVFLIFNDVLEKMVDTAFASVDHRQLLSTQAHKIFSCFYATLHQRVALSRILLKELVFYSAGTQAARFVENRRDILDRLEELARNAQASKKLRPDADPRQVGNAMFFLYSGEVRMWLAQDSPDLRAGIASLKKTFALLGRGLGEP